MKKWLFIIVLLALALGISRNSSAQMHTEFNYGLAFPTGDFQNFSPSNGIWNVQLQVRKQYTDRYSFGGGVGWSYFSHDFGRLTRTGEGFALTANYVSYTNVLMLHTVNQYDLSTGHSATPFIRLGAGVAHQNQRERIGNYEIEEKGWQFSLNPELGVRLRLRDDLGLSIAGGYHYMPAASGLVETSFWSLKLGLNWLRN